METELHSEHDHNQNEQRVVLIIAHDFPPYGMQSSLRPFKLATYLREFNWKVVVLCAPPLEEAFIDNALLDNDQLSVYTTTTSIGGFPLVQGKGSSVHYLSGHFRQQIGLAVNQTLSQPDNGKSWLKEALALGREIIATEKVEIILATAPPFTSLLAAQKLAQEFDIPFLVEYRDAWVESEERFYPTPFHRSVNARLENELLTLAEKIIVLSRYTKELLLRNYGFLEHNDIRILPHGFDPADSAVWSRTRPSQERFTLVTTVNFTGKQSPMFFLKALRKFLVATPAVRPYLDVRFVGLLSKRSVRLIKKYKLEDCVSYYGAVPHTEKHRHLAEAHVTWLSHANNYRPPEELYEYIGAGKPCIISTPSGVVSTTAQETGAAWLIPQGDINAMAEALAICYEQWKNNTLPVPNSHYAEQFTYRALAADLSRELGLAMKLV